MLETIINPLRFIRNHYGLTQTELAKKLGLTINDISRFEHGRTGLRIAKLQKIAEYFGVDTGVFFYPRLADVARSLTTPAVVSRKMTDRIKAKREVCDKIGRSGEDWVLEREMKKLAGTGCELGITSYADDPDAHCDFISFNKETIETLIIEVKTTSGSKNEPFHITAKELELAKECIENGIPYELHRVYNLNSPKQGRIIYTASDLFNEFDFEVYDYIVKKRKEKKHEPHKISQIKA